MKGEGKEKDVTKINVWSQFRDNSGDYIKEYMDKIRSLEYPNPEDVILFLGEGDSVDSTYEELKELEDDILYRVYVTKHDTSIPAMKHTPHPARIRCLAETGNAGWEKMTQVEQEKPWAEFALMCESDLIYPPSIVKDLIDSMPEDAGAIAPMIWMPIPMGDQTRLQFYDIWVYRTLDNRKFPPHNIAWYKQHFPVEIFPVYSVGSMVLIRMEAIMNGARFSTDGAVIGLCEDIRAQGWKVYVNPNLHIFHPYVDGIR